MNKDKENRLIIIMSAIADSPMGLLIGMALLILASSMGAKWDGHVYDRKGCVQLQNLNMQTYKVDTCSGDVELLKGKDTDVNEPATI